VPVKPGVSRSQTASAAPRAPQACHRGYARQGDFSQTCRTLASTVTLRRSPGPLITFPETRAGTGKSGQEALAVAVKRARFKTQRTAWRPRGQVPILSPARARPRRGDRRTPSPRRQGVKTRLWDRIWTGFAKKNAQSAFKPGCFAKGGRQGRHHPHRPRPERPGPGDRLLLLSRGRSVG